MKKLNRKICIQLAIGICTALIFTFVLTGKLPLIAYQKAVHNGEALLTPAKRGATKEQAHIVKGCPYCCCNVVNDSTSTVKQMLEACEKTQDKMCRDMCREAAKRHQVL